MKFFFQLLLSITSVKTDSVPYQSIQLAFSITPKLIYTSESNPTFSGYSYTTQDFNGGESNVIFTTGADSMNRLKNEMDLMKISEKYSQRENQENIMSSEQSKSVTVKENKNKQDLDLNVEVLNKEKKISKNPEADDNLIEHQMNLQQIPLIDVPYPVFRENLLNLHFPVFPRYQISNLIQTQYYPHNPYARLDLPLDNFGFYNPTAPLFYQTAAITPDSNSKPASTVIENMKVSVEPHYSKSSQTNVTSSESSSIKSSIIESKFNPESTTNVIEETSSSQSAISTNKLESMTSEKIREEITTSESAITSQSSVDQTTDNKENIESASTETNPSTEK